MPDHSPAGDGAPDADDDHGLPADRCLPIGWSVEGRPLRAWRFGADGAPALLVVGGVHGDEPSSVGGTLDLGRRLAAGAVAAAGPVWLVPALNPDGLARGQKNSARDVDLNRNFPAANFSPRHQPGYFPGTHPLSEPESAALAALIARVGIGAVVAVHAPFACINYDGPAAGWAGRVAAACGWPARADIGYPTPGSLGSWLGIDRGLPILTLELPPGPLDGFRRTCRVALDEALRVTL
ncbi:MAG TPA: M14 family zinc carboxypeptidase [Polyangia bacterium]|nr:M14 family zinc carboxypeptidase [Polyangia bacterium]